MPDRILIIEDEQAIAESVAYSLQKEGFEVLTAADGAEGLAAAQSEHPDLILLDLLLPEMNGLDVFRSVRRDSEVPIIMLTARGEEIDRVVGLELGADDYVTKPFSTRELVARVRTVLRRARSGGMREGTVLRSGDLEVDVARHEVTRGGQALRLTLKEYELLKTLMAHRGIVLTRDTLLDTVWGEEEYRDPRTVDVHIRWLREKIEPDPSSPHRIVTVRGVGYKFLE